MCFCDCAQGARAPTEQRDRRALRPRLGARVGVACRRGQPRQRGGACDRGCAPCDRFEMAYFLLMPAGWW